MILLIVLLLVGERAAACHQPTRVTGNVEVVGEPDDNSILESIRERDAKPSSPRSRRAAQMDSSLASMSSSTEANGRLAYESAINQTISDYYTQRKAVMDRYYARQRAIVEKFARKTPKPGKAAGVIFATSPLPMPTTTTTTTSQTILERATTVTTLEAGTTEVYREPERNGRPEDDRPAVNERGTDRADDIKGDKNPSTAWLYRSNNWNPRISDRDSDIDLEPESSNALETSVRQAAEIPGYYKLGNFKGTKDEKVVYQHNLGVGLKGSSQLDATFEAVIDGPYEITIVEAFPYANTRANFTWLGGGPGENFVKLKLKGYENEGFSYSVKVWGVPKDSR